MARITDHLRGLGAFALSVAIAGCAVTQPANFYTLSPAAEPTVAKRSAEGLVVGLGPITLPQYLDRPDIVTREGANQMQLAEFNKWAEPLEPMLTRIMAEDLYALLDASDVIPIPQRGDIYLGSGDRGRYQPVRRRCRRAGGTGCALAHL